MLSAADNDMLTQTGAHSPMGMLFRRFWMPALLSSELAEPDGPPVRVRLLGEDYVGFRDSAGKVGLVEPHCPHRGANLFFGRCEDGGIRCAYHGWKFDRAGQCLEATTLPRDAKYDAVVPRLGLHACAVEEVGGIVWAYLGPPAERPALPHFELFDMAPEQFHVSKKLQECNWAQSCEGALDTAHFSFLHMSINEDEQLGHSMRQSEASASGDANRLRWLRADPTPQFSILPHEAGLVLGAARRADGDDLYWRISQFLLPNHALAPSTFPGENYHGQCWVPIDDVSCWIYCYTWNPQRPIADDERARYRAGHTIHATTDAQHVPIRRRANDYLIDRDDQKRRSYTGIAGVSEQDQMIQDSQGFIVDRTREHLGPTDAGIVRFRRVMLDAARAAMRQQLHVAARHPEAFRVRAGGAVAHQDMSISEVMRARFGDVYGRVREGGANDV